MAISKGIHVFYISPRHSTGNRDRTSGINLYWLHMDGNRVLSNKQINLDADVLYGISAIIDDGWLNIFVTFEDGSVCKVSTEDGIKFYRELVPSVKTKVPTSVVHIDGKMNVFTKSYSNAFGLECLHRNVYYRGRWEVNIPMFDNNRNPIPLNNGPCAVIRNNNLNLFFSQGGTGQIKALQFSQNGSVIDYSPKDFLSWAGIAAALFQHQNKIMVCHRGTNGPRLYTAVVKSDNIWPYKEDTPRESLLNDNPGICIFGDRAFLFFQGLDNNLYLQLYMGDQWLMEPIALEFNKNKISDVWFGPAAIAI